MSTAISIRNVSKKYVIGKQKDGSLRGTLGGMFTKKEHKTEEFWALNDVSFDIQQGDVVGIIGKNGAGKSTLLKILSQITKPTTGSIEINGRVASLLEVGTGFHPELTGRENVYLNGTILGMTRNEVKAKFDEIVAFSGVEKFIDTPVKHYSSGMYVRLAFAVAAHLEPEILIIDEVLAVGDVEFQKKCLGKMGEVASEGRTVLFVSHNLGSVANLCNKSVLLSKGKIENYDVTDLIIKQYVNSTSTSNSLKLEDKKTNVFFTHFQLCDKDGVSRDSFAHNEDIFLHIDLKINLFEPNQNLEICLLKKDKSRIFTVNEKLLNFNTNLKTNLSLIFKLDQNLIAPNYYSFYCGLNSGTCTASYDYQEDICAFNVFDSGSDNADLEGLDYGTIIVPKNIKIK